jgi:hypothetical protein
MPVARLTTAALLMVAAGCTSFATALAEFDSVSQREGADQEPERIEYEQSPRRMPWALRQIEGLGVDAVLAQLLGIEPEPSSVENPPGFARERLRILLDRCGRDPVRCALVGTRVLWVAELDTYPLNQVEAIRGMGRILELQGMDPLAMLAPDPRRTTQAAVAEWLAAIETGWPGPRPGRARSAAERDAYLAALGAITELPLPAASDQRALLRALGRGYELESDAAVRPTALHALRRALYHGLCAGLRTALESPTADVREAAIRELHRLGGVDAIAFVLARISKPAALAANPGERYDEAIAVRRTLVRLCGQLDESRARRGRDGGPAPVEFLYETAAADADPGLRRIALEALAHCLRRPVSFDPEWAERWWVDYVARREGSP